MFELREIEELANQVNLSNLYEIAKNSAQIGNEILKVNYNKIQKISSKGRKGDLVTNVDLEFEKKGFKLAFSCRNGCCTSCAVKIKSGTLEQPEAMGVSQALKDKGYALLCVAKATSDLEVETTYEDEVYDLQFGQYFGRGNTRVAPPWEFEED